MIGERPQSKGEQTRAAIVNAAHSLFVEKGFHATSMRQIADQAGLALGGIYNHFGSKEDIFVAVLDAFHPYHDMLPALQNAEGATAEEYIRNAAERMVEALKRRPRLLNLMLIELVEFEGRHVPKLAERILPVLFGATAKIQEYRPQLRPVPLPVMMRAFIGLFFSYYVTDLLLQDVPAGQTEADWLGGMVDIYLHGVLQPSPEA